MYTQESRMALNLSFTFTSSVAVNNKHRSSPSNIGQQDTESDFHWHYLYQHCKLKIARHPQYITPLKNKILLLHGTTTILLSSVLCYHLFQRNSRGRFAPSGCFNEGKANPLQTPDAALPMILLWTLVILFILTNHENGKHRSAASMTKRILNRKTNAWSFVSAVLFLAE